MTTGATRCFPPNASFASGLTGVRYVYFSASGFAASSDVVRFPIDGISTHPSSFPNVRACGSSATHTCSSLANVAESDAALDESHDLALVHLGRGNDGSASNFEKLPTEMGISPATVITSITDASAPTPIGKHVPLVVNPSGVPRAFDVNQATRANPTIVGWGTNNVAPDAGAAAIVTRYSGPAEFEYGSGYRGFCIAPWDCNDNSPFVGACQSAINTLTNGRLLPSLNLRRASSVSQSYDGPTVGQGDSGSPALVFGGSGGGNVPELAATGPYVLGVLSKATLGGQTQGNALPPGTLQRMWYAPTFIRGYDGHGAPEGGAWLDDRFVDFDGDGVRNESDNCPWLANASQDDTNAVAEHVLFDGANPCTDPSAPPLPGSSAACLDYFRAHYKGDACDHDAVSRASLFVAPTDANGQCQNVQATPMGGYTFGGASSCPQHVNTGVRWSSRVGSRKGYGLPPTDKSEPTFCKCDLAGTNDEQCRNPSLAYKCLAARDNTFPAPDGQGLGSGWRRITRYTSNPPTNVLYPKLTTQHQYLNDPALTFAPPSLFAYDPSLEVTSVWSWPRDNATFGEPTSSPGYAGIFWSHVFRADFVRADGLQAQVFDAQRWPDVDLPNHYLSITTNSEGWNVVEVPVNGPNYWKWWLWGELTPSLTAAPIVKVLSNGGTDTLLVHRTEGGVTVANARLTSSALAALTPVATGARAVVLGDDVIGRAAPGSLPPALLISPSSLTVRGALLQAGWTVDAITAAQPQENQAMSLVAYAMRENTLFGLLNVGGDWTLRRSDVDRALHHTPDTVDTVAKVKAPRAMVYSDHERSLYVLDVDEGRLALVKVHLDGTDPTTLWRSDVIAELPLGSWLSVAASGEVVLSLTGIPGVGSEVVVMDPDGTPVASTARSESLALGAELTTGLALATWVNGQIGTYTSAPRASLGLALCGAQWLRAHRGNEANPLAQAVSCP